MAICIKSHKNGPVILLLGIHPEDIIEEKQKAICTKILNEAISITAAKLEPV